MASLKIHPTNSSFIHLNKTNPVSDISSSSRSLSVSKSHRVTASLSLSNQVKDPHKINGVKIDEWMKESVADIVKNLKQAPLLVHVYEEGDVRITTERAASKDWPRVKGAWESGTRKSPDGLIFVGELDKSDNVECEEGLTKAWGVVVQGKGVECTPACYLLKTSKVGAGVGMGLFCTHFCLARVQNFRDSALGQLKDCWLLQ